MPLEEDPLAPLSKLMERLSEVAKELGLDLRTFAVLPNPDPHMPHMVQAILELDPEMVFKTPEQRAEADTLRQMDLHLRRDTMKEKIDEARQGLIDSLADQMGTTREGLGLDENAIPEITPEEAELISCPVCGKELGTSPHSPRPDNLICDNCSWPLETATAGDVMDQPEPAKPDQDDVAQAERDDLARAAEGLPPATPDFDNMSVEEMLKYMEKNEGNEEPPLAGV